MSDILIKDNSLIKLKQLVLQDLHRLGVKLCLLMVIEKKRKLEYNAFVELQLKKINKCM